MAGNCRVPLIVVVAVFLLGLTTACGSDARSGGPPAATVVSAPRQTLRETGSTLLFPLMQTWAGAYHARVPGVTIVTAGTGSSAGIAGASAGTADIGTSDAYLSSGDLVTNPALLNIPLVISAQVIVYNVPGIGGQHLDLDGQVLARIYQGTITTWDDPSIARLNPHVKLPPGLRIVPVHRSDGSGDTFLFSSYLSTQDTAWNAAIGYGTSVAWPAASTVAEKGNPKMESTCATTPGCVAYLGISYLGQALKDNLGYAALRNAAGHDELPTPATINASVTSFVSSTPVNETISMVDGPAAGGYPIVNYEYAIVSTRQQDPARAQAIRDFLTWAITPGNAAAYLTPVRFEPLPQAVVSLARDQIARIG
jgi:phosphate transport system substrate-binding protein